MSRNQENPVSAEIDARLSAIIEISSNIHTAYLHDEAKNTIYNGNLKKKNILDEVINELANKGYAGIERRTLIELSTNMFSTVDILMRTENKYFLRKTVAEQLSHTLNAASTINESKSLDELNRNLALFNDPFHKLNHLLTYRLKDLCNSEMYCKLVQARRRLRINYELLYNAKYVTLELSNIPPAHENSEYIYKLFLYSIIDLRSSIKCTASQQAVSPNLWINISESLDILNKIPFKYLENYYKIHLKEKLESVVKESKDLLSSSRFRQCKSNLIQKECIKLEAYIKLVFVTHINRTPSEHVDEWTLKSLIEIIKRLKDVLVDAVQEELSDCFANKQSTVEEIVQAALAGHPEEVGSKSINFFDYFTGLLCAASSVSMLSGNMDEVEKMKIAKNQLEQIYPILIFSALTVATKPNYKGAKLQLNRSKEIWLQRHQFFEDRIDHIINIKKFLEISEAHISEDTRNVKIAYQRAMKNKEEIKTTFLTASNRRKRVSVVINKMITLNGNHVSIRKDFEELSLELCEKLKRAVNETIVMSDDINKNNLTYSYLNSCGTIKRTRYNLESEMKTKSLPQIANLANFCKQFSF